MRMNLNDEELHSIIGDDTEGWEGLREEWMKWYHAPDREDRSDQTIADWWLSRFSSHLSLLEGKIVPKESKKHNFTVEGRHYDKGFNKCREIVLANIKKKYENLK